MRNPFVISGSFGVIRSLWVLRANRAGIRARRDAGIIWRRADVADAETCRRLFRVDPLDAPMAAGVAFGTTRVDAGEDGKGCSDDPGFTPIFDTDFVQEPARLDQGRKFRGTLASIQPVANTSSDTRGDISIPASLTNAAAALMKDCFD